MSSCYRNQFLRECSSSHPRSQRRLRVEAPLYSFVSVPQSMPSKSRKKARVDAPDSKSQVSKSEFKIAGRMLPSSIEIDVLAFLDMADLGALGFVSHPVRKLVETFFKTATQISSHDTLENNPQTNWAYTTSQRLCASL